MINSGDEVSQKALLDKIRYLESEAKKSRNELNNLRQQVTSLKYWHRSNIQHIIDKLKNFNCDNCQAKILKTTVQKFEKTQGNVSKHELEEITIKPIGYLETDFPHKRAIPRQTNLALNSKGKLKISKLVFSNPHHALLGLEEYSHMWILFYFHQTESNGNPAKVSPPRLMGEKTGVFATRSPHRPCRIGLSLVQIDEIKGSEVYFSGVDMLNGTPILDIKPYIPQYDTPQMLNIEGCEGGNYSDLSLYNDAEVIGREAPDGQESEEDAIASAKIVTYPSWTALQSNVKVELTDEAEQQLTGLNKLDMWPTIGSILTEDPRSVYIKQKYGNQFYTFLISDLHVSCKFNDAEKTVVVYKIDLADKNCDCGKIEWQCPIHSQVNDSDV